MTAAVPDPREDIDWSKHRGSCRVFYAERRCTCGASPAEPTGELRERIYREVVLTEAVSANGASHIADALLSGPLAPLLAKLRAVEALAAERTVEGSWVLRGKLRRALDAS